MPLIDYSPIPIAKIPKVVLTAVHTSPLAILF